MLNQYKNITEIQNRTKSVSGERLSKSKTEFLDFPEERIFFNFSDPFAGGGKISQYQVQNATKDIVIANSEFDVGDTFGIAALAGTNTNDKYSTINAAHSYWSITDASKNVDEWNREI